MDATPMEWASPEPQSHQVMLLPKIRQFLPRSGTLLDVGCGNGWLTEQYRLSGLEAAGVDISSSGIAVARAAFPKVHFSLMGSELGGPYDCIIASEVIEHLYEPQRLLAQCFSSLRPGGRLILTTPYHGYLKNFAISLFGKWDKHFSVFHTGGHIKFFSRTTLGKMMREAGFDRLQFAGAGRGPLVWESMIMTGDKPQ